MSNQFHAQLPIKNLVSLSQSRKNQQGERTTSCGLLPQPKRASQKDLKTWQRCIGDAMRHSFGGRWKCPLQILFRFVLRTATDDVDGEQNVACSSVGAVRTADNFISHENKNQKIQIAAAWVGLVRSSYVTHQEKKLELALMLAGSLRLCTVASTCMRKTVTLVAHGVQQLDHHFLLPLPYACAIFFIRLVGDDYESRNVVFIMRKYT